MTTPPPTQLDVEHTNLVKLKQKLREELLRELRVKDAPKAPLALRTFVFNEVVMAAPFLDNFKMPSITPYNEKGDLMVYVEVFRSWVNFERVSKPARCQALSLTLSKLA